ncbi:MAG TPA: hypothetical protein VMN77_11550 [Nitrospiria bacterium]|jgi:hypothetical protein|nr:hypothetical protein [Nitrospiria bacterium]
MKSGGTAASEINRLPFAIGVALLCGLSGVYSAVHAADPIDRKAGPVRLGMTVGEFQKAVKSSEQTGENPGLIGDERSFEVLRESLPPEIRVMGCRFLHGRLYRVSVEYRPGYFDEARWDDWIKKNMQRYGKVPIESKTLGERPFEFVQWDDPQTRLVLQREHRMRFESKQLVKQYNVVMILLDQALWNERQEAEGSVF